jgi:formate dehydrogenase beta subunit
LRNGLPQGTSFRKNDVTTSSGFNQEDQALAPCQQTCPAEIDIPKYIRLIKEGDYEGAVNTIRERNPLLLSCGRVCPHPCEDYCRRGIEDEPVSINQLKRFVADYEMNSGTRYPIPCAPDTGKRVAIIGGGPAGVSCAYFLRRVGHHPTIYEAMSKLGGITRYGIPEYRLPDKVLDWEIEGILNLGIDVHYNTSLGEDFTIQSLRDEGYEAIFMGVGAWKDYTLGIKGEDLNGVTQGIKFLSAVANSPEKRVPIGKRAAVVGGGNSAIDCVRTLLRLGCEEVWIVYRRTRKEMPANEVEIVASEHEGIKFQFLAAPTRVIDDGNGNVAGLEYLQMELGEPDASGRRRPVPIEGSETVLDVDMVISAISQQPDVSFMETEPDKENIEITRWNTFDNDPELLQCSAALLVHRRRCRNRPLTGCRRHRRWTSCSPFHSSIHYRRRDQRVSKITSSNVTFKNPCSRLYRGWSNPNAHPCLSFPSRIVSTPWSR